MGAGDIFLFWSWASALVKLVNGCEVYMVRKPRCMSTDPGCPCWLQEQNPQSIAALPIVPWCFLSVSKKAFHVPVLLKMTL